jgi:diguanylate cyclase (GGDEF)-like protein
MKFRVPGFRFQGSLRARFALGLGAMLLPLALLGASALFLLNHITAALDEVVEEAIEEMHPIIHLQTLTLRAAMPPNDYLIDGDPAEKSEFARLSGEVDRAFEETLAGPVGLANKRDLVRAAREEWRLAKAIALSLLALPHPVGNPAAALEMKRMDAHFDRAVDLLGKVHDMVHRETEEALARAHAARRWAYTLIAGIFIAGIAVAGWAAFALSRSVLLPLRALEVGAKRFGAGDLSHRVELNRPDELGQLAQTFNAMAEALEKSRAVLDQRSSQLNALNQIAIAITSLLSLQDILNEIMRCGIVLTGAKASCIAFYEEATAHFTQWVTQGLSEHFVGNLAFSPGGLADEAFTSGSHILSNDRPETGHKLSRLAREEGLQCFICLPLTSRDRRLGVIYFYRTDRDTFTPTEIELLITFASLAAQAIEKARLYAQVQEQARTDALTGLNNRGEFQRQLKEEEERSRRYNRSFSLLMLDIDHFKSVNDSYGHQAGDEVLRALAARLREQTRPADQVARYGGEEFVVILPEIASEGALALAERLRAAVADSAVAVTEGRTIPVTISIGVATFPADAGSETALIAAADTALYAAKQGGRNRTMRYQAATGQAAAQA